MTSLYRFLQREADSAQRNTAESIPSQPNSSPPNIDPWKLIVRTASTSQGVAKSLQWLLVFACSGLEIPIPTYYQLATRVTTKTPFTADCLSLMKALFTSVWLKAMGCTELLSIVTLLHSRLGPVIVESVKNDPDTSLTDMYVLSALCPTTTILYL